jgi:FSR family fosmidomycin resistance protein-like MFS transporter
MKSPFSPTPSRILAVGTISFAHLVNDLYVGALAPILPLLVVKYGISLAVAGGLGSIQVMAAFSQPVFGYLSDRWFGRAFLFIGPLLAGLGMGALGLSPNFAIMVALLVVAGLGASAFHPPAAATANLISGSRKGLGVSVFLAAGSMGRSLGPLLIAFAVGAYGLTGTWVMAVPAVIAVALMAFLPAVRPNKSKLNLQATGRILGAHTGQLFLLWLIVVLRNTVNINFRIFLPLLLAEQGKPLQLGGALIAVYFFAGAAGIVMGGYVADRFGPRLTLVVSAMAGIPFFYLTLYSSELISILTMALAGISLMSAHSICLLAAQEILPDQTSTISGLMLGVALSIGGLTAPFFGWMADLLGLTWTLNLLIASLAITIPIAIAIPFSRRAANLDLKTTG